MKKNLQENEKAELEGKVAIVTGGATGIGKSTAFALSKLGAKVVIANRRRELGIQTAHEINSQGGDASYIATDVSSEDSVEQLVKSTLDTYGRLDFAVNNAGAPIMGSLTSHDLNHWDRIMEVNLKGVWLCMKHQIPAMLKFGGGSIVNISSICSVLGSSAFSLYSASKAGVNALTRCAAIEFASKGIRVNTISPGPVKTDMQAVLSEEEVKQIVDGIPMRKNGMPNNIADVAVFLCSEKAAFITAQNLVVDGGFTLKWQ